MKERASKFNTLSRHQQELWVHPVVRKALAVNEFYRENSTAGNKDGEIEYVGRELISVNGKVLGGFKQAGKTKPKPKQLGVAQPGKASAQGSMAALMMGGAGIQALMGRRQKEEEEEPEPSRPGPRRTSTMRTTDVESLDPSALEEVLEETHQMIARVKKDLEKYQNEERRLLAKMGR